MDAKILAAVLVSLAAVFAGADGGMFSTDDIRNIQQDTGFQAPSTDSITSNIPLINDFLEKPKPTNQIKAQIILHGEEQFRVKQAGLKAGNLTEINARNMKIDSDKDIEFNGYNGKIKLSNETILDGSAKGFQTSNVNITAATGLNTVVKTDKIEVDNTSKIGFKFSKASISPTQNSNFSLDTSNTNLDINSFTGDVIVYPEEKRIVIDGKVDKLNAGKYSLEG